MKLVDVKDRFLKSRLAGKKELLGGLETQGLKTIHNLVSHTTPFLLRIETGFDIKDGITE